MLLFLVLIDLIFEIDATEERLNALGVLPVVGLTGVGLDWVLSGHLGLDCAQPAHLEAGLLILLFEKRIFGILPCTCATTHFCIPGRICPSIRRNSAHLLILLNWRAAADISKIYTI